MLWSWGKQGEGWHKGQIRAPSSRRAARTAPNPSSLLTSRCFLCWVSSEGPVLAIPERAERKEWSFYWEYFKGTDVSGRRYFDGVPLSKSWQQPPAESERFGGTKQSDRLLDSVTESDIEAAAGSSCWQGWYTHSLGMTSEDWGEDQASWACTSSIIRVPIRREGKKFREGKRIRWKIRICERR